MRKLLGAITRNVHDESISSNHRSLHGNLVTVLIFCFRDVEYGEDGGGKDEQRRIHKVTSRTDPLANSKCQSDCWVISEVSILVKESFGFKFLWFWVSHWVVQDRPEISQMNGQIQVDRNGHSTMHWLL